MEALNLTPNAFATIVFYGWGIVTLLAFAALRPQVAFIVSQLGGTLLLPEVVVMLKIQGIPGFDKQQTLPLYSLLGLLLFQRHVLRRFRFGAIDALFILFCLLGVVTAWSNLDAVRTGPIKIDGHTVYDAVNITVASTLKLWLPLTLARLLFRTKRDLRTLLVGLVWLSTVYAIPFLWEVRMSPMLNHQWYGYMQHDFMQTVRGDGYRPMVFMAHGLALAMMNASAFIAAVALMRGQERVGRFRAGWFALLLGALLAIGRSFGALLFGVVGMVLTIFARPRRQMAVVALLGTLVLFYPFLRVTGIFPHEDVLEVMSSLNEDRSASLAFRFTNEEALMERASERPLFGWGDYCRSCVFSPKSGAQTSVADGMWVIMYGSRGFLGFMAFFGMLFVPIWAAWRRIDLVPDPVDRRLLAALGLIVGFNLLDYLPNSMFEPPLAMVLFGALHSLVMGLSTAKRRRDDDALTSLPELVGRISAGFDAFRPVRPRAARRV